MKIILILFMFLVGCIGPQKSRNIAAESPGVEKSDDGYLCRFDHPLVQSIPEEERFSVGGIVDVNASFEAGQECDNNFDKICSLCRQNSSKKEILVVPKKILETGAYSEIKQDSVALESCIDEQIKSSLLDGKSELPTRIGSRYQEALIFARSAVNVGANYSSGAPEFQFLESISDSFYNLAELVKTRCGDYLTEPGIGVIRRTIKLEQGYEIRCEHKRSAYVGLSDDLQRNESDFVGYKGERTSLDFEMLLAVHRQLLVGARKIVEWPSEDSDELGSGFGMTKGGPGGYEVIHPDYSSPGVGEDRFKRIHEGRPMPRAHQTLSSVLDLKYTKHYEFEKHVKAPCEKLQIDVTGELRVQETTL